MKFKEYVEAVRLHVQIKYDEGFTWREVGSFFGVDYLVAWRFVHKNSISFHNFKKIASNVERLHKVKIEMIEKNEHRNAAQCPQG